MKIVNLIKSEFIKNYTLKKLFFISVIILIITSLFVEGYNLNLYKNFSSHDRYSYYGSYNESEENLSNEKKFNLEVEKSEKKYYGFLKSQKVEDNDYRVRLIEDIINKKRDNIAIEFYKDNKDSEEIKYICSLNKTYYDSAYEGSINYVCNRVSEIDKIYKENEKVIKDYEELLNENKYYKYIEYKLESGLIDSSDQDLAKIIIKEKITSQYHYLSSNYIQHFYLPNSFELESEEEFNSYKTEYSSYDQYIKFKKNLAKDAREMKSIIEYSSKNKIPHDLFLNRYDGGEEILAFNSKKSVDFIFHYSIIVILIVTVTSSGIMSKEHKEGTIKKIITTPIKRWKILLSKFIYLILHTYIIWLICLVILSLYSGYKYGFSDLFTPKLIYVNNKVIEANYFLYLIKDLFIASIPVICFLSILLFLSTVTLNTSITNLVCTLLSVLSIVFWYLIEHFKFLLVTPLMYFDTGFMHTRSNTYMEALTKFDISYSYGILISILVTLILFIITNIIYNKRDI